MISGKDKISLRQAVLIYLTIVYIPATRIFPIISAKELKQAGWITPVAPVLILFLYIWIIGRLFNKFKEGSFVDILYKVFGKTTGFIIGILYLVTVIVETVVSLGFFGARITSTIFPNTNIALFWGLMIILLMYTLRGGIVVLARMNELTFLITLVFFAFSTTLIMPAVKVSNLLPVTYKDIIPAVKLGLRDLMPVYSWFMLICLIGDKVNNKEKIFRYGIYAGLFLLQANILMIIVTIGALGSSVVARLNHPFFTALRNISVFELQRFEAIAIAIWMFSDFVTISIWAVAGLYLLKSLFNLKEDLELRFSFLSFIFAFILIFAINRFELEEFSATILANVEHALFLFVPVITLVAGKVRRKI